MNILVIGSGGREHAFRWKLAQSTLCEKLFIAPGNAGTAQLGENVSLAVNDFEAIGNFCVENHIELVVVGPEEPLVNGIYDYFEANDRLKQIAITGPSKAGAQLEGSKAFSKEFMVRNHIPTARYREFTANNYQAGLDYIASHPLPLVLKADGLAAGKGVIICHSHTEAATEFNLMIHESKFGTAGSKVVIEEFLDGLEVSVFVLTDGKNYVLLPEAKDYKKIGEGEQGLNTGGMGAISPVPFATTHFMDEVTKKIIEPTINGLRNENIDYRGFIFFGLIKVDNSPYVIEYNCRMGDPETEVVMLRLKNDLAELLLALPKQTLHKHRIECINESTATIVAVSGGYPREYKKGYPIDFAYLLNPQARKHIDEEGGAYVFHAGTTQQANQVVTAGGRVLAVSAMAKTLAEAVELSKEILDQIHFEGMYYRKDIGYEFFE